MIVLCLIRIFRDSYIAVKTVATFDGIALARESLSQTISLKIVAFSVTTWLLLQIAHLIAWVAFAAIARIHYAALHVRQSATVLAFSAGIGSTRLHLKFSLDFTTLYRKI